MTTIISLILGYVLGSIPFGLVLTKLAGTEDIRTIGSGNIGATNVLRTGRKGLAAGTLLLDALKGTAAVLIGQWLGGPEAALAGGFGAFLGHLFPVWLKFNGGKGVATFLGILLGLSWPMFLLAAGLWLAVAYLTKYSSLSALVMSAAMPVIFLIMGRHGLAALFLVLSALLWWKHRLNIERLRAGTESRIGQKG